MMADVARPESNAPSRIQERRGDRFIGGEAPVALLQTLECSFSSQQIGSPFQVLCA
jgi:hypothetical protein